MYVLCVELWIKVMIMDEERVMKIVMLEALEMRVKVKWDRIWRKV